MGDVHYRDACLLFVSLEHKQFKKKLNEAEFH